MQWYYAENGAQKGPVEFEQLKALIGEGRLKPNDLVWTASMGDQWSKAASVPGLFNVSPPALAGDDAAAAGSVTEWSNTTTFLGATPNRDLMAQARSALDGHWGVAIGSLVIYILINIVLTIIPVIGDIVSFVISGPLMLGWTLFFMTLARGEAAEIGQLFQGFKQFGNAFVASLLMMLLILAWMLPAIAVIVAFFFVVLKGALEHSAPDVGAMLLWIPFMLAAIIPAIIAQFRYAQTYYILNDFTGVGPLEAIRRSKQMMVGNKWKLFCLQCRFIGWSLLCILSLGIGFLWLVPYIMTSTAQFYLDVKASAQRN